MENPIVYLILRPTGETFATRILMAFPNRKSAETIARRTARQLSYPDDYFKVEKAVISLIP